MKPSLLHFLLPFLLTLTLFAGGCGDDKPNEPKEPEVPEVPEVPGKTPAEIRQEIGVFFDDHLLGKNVTYGDTAKLSLSSISVEKEMVWEAWKDANNNFSEEKLIAIQELSKRNYGSWQIPPELEPDAVMPYYWGSKGTMPDEGFPLFVYMHGSGNKDTEWATGMTLALRFQDGPSAYFIPQIPNTNYYRWYPKSKQFAWEKLLRLSFVSGEVDPNKVYFFGISEGGYGTQRLASFYADYLAGAGPMAGGEPLINAPVENCRNTAFSLRTGANDTGFHRNKLTQYTKEEFDKFQAESPGSFVNFIELIPGAGHGIDYNPTTPWLRGNTRNPYPKTVTWEDFEMDGRYRKGFHNLVVNQRPDDDSRTYYQMDIKGNEITLDVNQVTYETTEIDPTWGIHMKFAKTYTPATKGKLTIYLCEELVDLDSDIKITVNGLETFNGILIPERRHLVNSCAIFFDPARLYPAAIEIDLEKL